MCCSETVQLYTRRWGAGSRARSNLIAVAIDCLQLQFFEIAELIVNWVAITIAIASTLTALNWFEDCYKSVEASTFKKNIICMRHAPDQIHYKAPSRPRGY